MLEYKVFELHQKAQNVAFSWYIRKGFVPPLLTEILAATMSLDTFRKYNPDWPNQPRVPAGHPGQGGRWTDGNGGNSPEDEVYDPPLEPVYPELLILPFLRTGRLILALRRFIESGRRNADWKFGSFKSPQRWANQMEARKWTPNEITETVKNGTSYRVENRVNPGNMAKQYMNPTTKRFVVRDEVTKEILQVGSENLKPNPPLK